MVEVNRLFGDVMITPQRAAKSRNGVKYATLCQQCNNNLSDFDAALAHFSQAVVRYLYTAANNRDIFEVMSRPGAMTRSILGHFLAGKLESDRVPTDGWIREYLNGGALDDRLKLYYWFYPYYFTILARDFVFQDLANWWKMDGLANVMKFFPLAFMLTDSSVSLPFQTLHDLANLAPDEEQPLSVNFELAMSPFWPERPDRNHVVLGGAAFMDAICSLDGHFGRRLREGGDAAATSSGDTELAQSVGATGL